MNFIWKIFARLLAHPWVVRMILSSAYSKPYFHLDGYMYRWWLTPGWLLGKDKNGNAYPYSWVPMIFRVRVHHILRADNDRHMHDHPADNRSVVLRGHYYELDESGLMLPRVAGDTVYRKAKRFHRIAGVSEGGVLTLFFLGKKSNEWGFMVDGRKIPHEEYFKGHD